MKEQKRNKSERRRLDKRSVFLVVVDGGGNSDIFGHPFEVCALRESKTGVAR